MKDPSSPSIGRPYLSGFEFARFDDPAEVSEAAAQGGDNNYRHPNYQLPLTRKHKYRRSYEIYSLGAVLIEICLWNRIESFRQPKTDAAMFAKFLKDTIVPYVGFYTGSEYQTAASNCLIPKTWVLETMKVAG